MKRLYSLYVIAVVLVASLCLVVYIRQTPKGPPSYWSFSRHRSQLYYSHIADACDQVIAALAIQHTNEIRLEGNDVRLPQILRAIHATQITVSTNRVWVVVGIAAGYGVVWEQDDFNAGLWRLTIRGEAEPQYLFERTKPNPIGQPHPP